MGYGSWTTSSYTDYRATTKACSMDSLLNATVSDIYTERGLNQALSPLNVMREARDSEEHPNSLPVIIGLDVTGSMGSASAKCAQKLSDIMTEINKKTKDVQFMFMGIGDVECDRAPIQLTQFESDVRIAEQMEKIYFEGGGGGNNYESYTAAWYMGSRHCDLDCWKKGQKGIIITLGDEPLNPILQDRGTARVTGDNLQSDVKTAELYDETAEKYDIYHLSVDDSSSSYNYRKNIIDKSFEQILPDGHYKVVTLDQLANVITAIIEGHYNSFETLNAVESNQEDTAPAWENW